MRFLHIADLHLGKPLCGLELWSDQQHILRQLADTARARADAVLIAGDVYDRKSPSIHAVRLLDDFLTRLAEYRLPVFIISGNHDAPERLDYASRILRREGVYITGSFDGQAVWHTLSDEYGPVNLCLLPYVSLPLLRDLDPDCDDLHNGMLRAIGKVDTNARNVILAHQYVVEGEPGAALGGVDGVSASLFDDFDYAALGHLHQPIPVGRSTCRYAGSPLKYSTDEAVGAGKTCPIVTLGAKGKVSVELVELHPLRELRRVQGRLEDILSANPPSEDFLYVRLTDTEPVYDAVRRLQSLFPNLVRTEWTERSEAAVDVAPALPQETQTPSQLFEAFFRLVHHRELTPEEQEALDIARKEAGL